MNLGRKEDRFLNTSWEIFINKAQTFFESNSIPLYFPRPKQDGSHAKAKSGFPCVFFVFAQDSRRNWVELELKPRTENKTKSPQTQLYECLRENYLKTSQKKYRITWNEEDLKTSPRRETGSDIRIKIYLNNRNEDETISAMAYLYRSFLPLLEQCSKQ